MMNDNHTRIGNGFRALLKALAPGICQELRRRYQTDWWQRGVLDILREEQKRNLPLTGDDSTLCQALDVQRCLILFEAHWQTIFRKKFSDDYRAWAKELHGVRNRWAHAGGEDFSDKFTQWALGTMARFCESWDAGAAEAIREIRRGGAHVAPGDTPSRRRRSAGRRRRPRRRSKTVAFLGVLLILLAAASFLLPRYAPRQTTLFLHKIERLKDWIAEKMQNKGRKGNDRTQADAIQCWQDETGRKIYGNMRPTGKKVRPCK